MRSTENSSLLLNVQELKIYFELEHFQNKNLRDVFISALTNPVEHFFRNKEILPVIDGISFDLHRGTRLGIIGINGTGKTTLCRAIAGMIHPSKGKIVRLAQIRAIFDTGSGVMPELTGRENAQLLARLFFPEKDDISSIVEEAIEFSEIGHFADIPFNRYSKGMQARVLLSLISAVPSDLLILDEVFDGADIFFQEKLASRMKKFIEEAGATIFVSHSLDQVMKVCTEVMILDLGKIVFRGPPEEAWRIYKDLKRE